MELNLTLYRNALIDQLMRRDENEKIFFSYIHPLRRMVLFTISCQELLNIGTGLLNIVKNVTEIFFLYSVTSSVGNQYSRFLK